MKELLRGGGGRRTKARKEGEKRLGEGRKRKITRLRGSGRHRAGAAGEVRGD